MKICATCFELYGNVTRRYQSCFCKEKPGVPAERGDWSGWDFPQAVELCHCCGHELISSGTRWSVFYCEPCRVQVIALNKQSGFAVIPLGRHSMMNNFALDPRAPDRANEIRTFIANANGLFERIKRLDTWRKRIVAQTLRTAGLPEGTDVELEDYLLGIASRPSPKRASIEELAAFLSATDCGPG